SVASRALPLPKAEPQRVAIVADTGCRMKKADNAFQACSDATVWPFATIAASIAKLNPDLLLHVGDYHYRENACPPDIAG
ncbi:serine/threonine protein phosphatase, partial [Burkholderia pseudomallei]|nr:serine/threonine protein phosphatase [Burkholderia pseudomallei]